MSVLAASDIPDGDPDPSQSATQSVRSVSNLIVTDDADSGRLVGASLALALLRATPDPVFLAELDGRVTFVNIAGQKQLQDRGGPQGAGCYLWDLWGDIGDDLLRQALTEACDGESVALPAQTAGAGDEQILVSPVEDAVGQVAKILIIRRSVRAQNE